MFAPVVSVFKVRPGGVLVQPLERACGVLSLVAGAIHGVVTPEHFEEWWGYGLFFVFAGALQLLFGLAILARAVNAKDTGPDWRTWKRRLFVFGIVLNVAIIALYAVTRTVGIPFFGPEAGEVEKVAAIDVVSKLVEALLVGMLVVLVRRPVAEA